MREQIEAEIVEDNKSVVLKEIKYPVNINDINKLLEEYKSIPDINPNINDEDLLGEQYQFVVKGHKAFVKMRGKIEKTRKELKEPSLAYGKTVDGIAKEFQALIKITEDKLSFQRKLVEDNELRKQVEAEALEETRITNIKTMILNTKNLPLSHFNSNSEALTKALESLIVIDRETYEEFYDEAVESQNYVIAQLQTARINAVTIESAEKIQAEANEKARIAKEIEDAAIAKERKEFEDEKAAFAKMKQDAQDVIDLQNEEIAREKADKEADEQLAKEKQAVKDKELIDSDTHDMKMVETMSVLKGYTDMIVLIDDIISEKIPNVRWVK
jgi:hypothetical protein